MIRRTWISSLWIAAIAAACALAIYLVAAWALSVAAPNMWFDADFRGRLSDEVQRTAASLENQHKPLAFIAQAIVARVNGFPGFSAAVVDESGKLLAGNADLVVGRSFGPMGGPPERDSSRARESGSIIYGMRPPITHGIGFLRTPLDAVSSPPSIVHISGATVIFRPTQDALASIQSLERWIALGIVALTFVVVLLLSQRTLGGALQPMDRIRAALLRLAKGDHARFETFTSGDDVATELVDAYNAAASEMSAVSTQRAEIEAKIRQFVADAGHELRTPLAVIMGYVQLLRQSGQTDSAMSQRVFSEIDDQGKRMSVLIQKLLLLTRLESQEPHDVKILDAADVAKSVIDSFRPLANGSVLSVNAQHDSFIQVSESELHEAVGNLIDNALKYAPGAHVEARVRSDGGSVVVAVTDDGPGMSPEVRVRAFERFSRGETGGYISGSGLGLAIVERAVQRAGGSVSLQTAIGKGTTIELRFPAWQHAQT